MKTDELIGMLATGGAETKPNAVGRRYAIALVCGVTVAVILMLMIIGGPRPDLSAAAHLPMFWVKLAFPTIVLVAALFTAGRLSRPGARLGLTPAGLLLPVIVIWSLAAVVLPGATPAEREWLIYGVSWKVCSMNVAMLSAPVFVGTLWAMKGLAPTAPVQAGAVSGLLAGATGALVYSFYCPEMAAPFIGAWYTLGMLIPAVLGGVVGAKVLRW